MKNKLLSVQAFVGIITPLVTLLYIILLGQLKPGYNSFQMTISYLGTGSSCLSSLVSFLFISSGVMFSFFAFGLNSVLKEKTRFNSAIFIILFSFFDLIISGFFPTDLIDQPPSFIGFIHSTGSFIGDFFLLLSFYLLYTSDASIFHSQYVKPFALFTLIFSIFCIFITIIFHIVLVPNFPYGFIQKAEFTVIFLFLSFLGLQLFKYSILINNENTKIL